jgi:hypothetical protein
MPLPQCHARTRSLWPMQLFSSTWATLALGNCRKDVADCVGRRDADERQMGILLVAGALQATLMDTARAVRAHRAGEACVHEDIDVGGVKDVAHLG